MSQAPLFEHQRIVNVATVPQRSPFRYPGGKTWLVPRIRQWLGSLSIKPIEMIEPFAGGGIVSLTVAAERLTERVTMIEVDEQVASVWQTILDDGTWLAEKIVTFQLTYESLVETLSKEPRSVREKAFQTILKNRTYRGGILAAGSAPLKHGENGKGIASRWYPETLRRRIIDISAISDRITFIKGDGLEAIKENANHADRVFFIDPPYTAGGKRAGSRLYTHSYLNHEELFRVVSTVKGDFLMTYDASDEVLELAKKYNFDTELVPMKNTHHAAMKELLIGRKLNWTRPCQERSNEG